MSKLSDLPLPVVLGLSLAGALVGFVLATFLAPSAKSGSELHVGEVSAAESRGADLENTRARTVEELERELMRLTAQLDAEPRSMRQRADATAPRPNSQPSDPELESAEPLTANSLALLQAVLAEYGSEEFANAIEAQAAADSVDAVARALFFAYTNAQRPYDAERVLDLFVSLGAGFQPNPWELSNLASQFATLGDTGRATDLLGRALRLDPNNFDFANRLADLDPALGLAAFNEANQDGKLTERYEGRRNLALFLIKGGDLEGGLAMLHNPDGTLEPNAWDLFFEHAPEQALTELREAAKDDPYGTLGMRLARHLGSHDNVAEALETLEGMLLQNPSNTQAMAYLAELDPERGLDLMAAGVAANPDSSEAWMRYAEQLKQAGRMEEAVQAGLASFRLASNSWPDDYLLEAAPDEIVSIFRQRVEGSLDDELWGDYGDTLMRTNRPDEALEAWKRARTIDTDDGEWIEKIKQLEAGVNPFAEGASIQSLGYFGGLGYSDSVIEFEYEE